MRDLKTKILTALEGSTSQNPVDIKDLYSLGTRQRISQALLALYEAREVSCCKITTRGEERNVWWRIGTLRTLPKYGKVPLAQIRLGNAL